MNTTSSNIEWDFPDPHLIKIEVTGDDIDGYGHVNNAVYVSWLDRCAFDHCDAVGINAELCQSLNRGMAAIRHEIDYLIAGYQGDRIIVADWVTYNDSKLRAQRRFQMVRVEDQKTLLRCVSNYVCTDLTSGRPARMPSQFVSGFCVLPSVAKTLLLKE
jgi:acyl-CoA thioester hydrolase